MSIQVALQPWSTATVALSLSPSGTAVQSFWHGMRMRQRSFQDGCARDQGIVCRMGIIVGRARSCKTSVSKRNMLYKCIIDELGHYYITKH